MQKKTPIGVYIRKILIGIISYFAVSFTTTESFLTVAVSFAAVLSFTTDVESVVAVVSSVVPNVQEIANVLNTIESAISVFDFILIFLVCFIRYISNYLPKNDIFLVSR